MDMSIDLQVACEEQLRRPGSCVDVEFKGITYVFDLEAMTQLNTWNGSLRMIRRRVLWELR